MAARITVLQLRESPMPLYFIAFPAFDPVLFRFGPIAIRWYALAYIVGILLGWLYARTIIKHRDSLEQPAAPDGDRLR